MLQMEKLVMGYAKCKVNDLLTQWTVLMVTKLEMKLRPSFMLTCKNTFLKGKKYVNFSTRSK